MGFSTYCAKCGFVGPEGIDDTLRPACRACGSQEISPCAGCSSCRKAVAVIEEECIPCTVAFYSANPAEFDPNEKGPKGELFWLMTPDHYEAAERITAALQRRNTVGEAA